MAIFSLSGFCIISWTTGFHSNPWRCRIYKGQVYLLLINVGSNLFFCAEVYRFLSSEVRAYLPSYETVTVWHLRDLAMGVKTIIKCDAVKVIDVPQFEGLAIQ
jgi:hypothetical protein